MKLGVFAPLQSPQATPAMLADLAAGAEELGLDSIWVGEHVVTVPDYQSAYPGSADGRIPIPPGAGLLDITASLAFLAAHTSTVRLGTGICLLPQRNPVYTAKEFATLDWLSDGRIDLGIGVGWSWEEFEACNVPWERRGARCDEYLEVLRSCWVDEVSSHDGEIYPLRRCHVYPKPVQRPHIPIHVGGHSDAAMARVARVGRGWYGFGTSPASTATDLARLADHLHAAGRSLDDVQVTLTPGHRITPDDVATYAELGVDVLAPMLSRQRHERLPEALDVLRPLAEAANATA
ncbi:MAG: LLM class F420-dependent oxidoreductase [Acidimicrobiales bacterium]